MFLKSVKYLNNIFLIWKIYDYMTFLWLLKKGIYIKNKKTNKNVMFKTSYIQYIVVSID